MLTRSIGFLVELLHRRVEFWRNQGEGYMRHWSDFRATELPPPTDGSQPPNLPGD